MTSEEKKLDMLCKSLVKQDERLQTIERKYMTLVVKQKSNSPHLNNSLLEAWKKQLIEQRHIVEDLRSRIKEKIK
jgi:hypothetical protein